MIEQALRDLVDPIADVYPVQLPQDAALPALVYQRISTRRDHTHDGPPDLAAPRFQFSCWDATYAGAKALAADLRGTLDGFKGTVGTVRIDGILSAGEHDDYDQEPQRYRVISDFIVWHAEEDESS